MLAAGFTRTLYKSMPKVFLFCFCFVFEQAELKREGKSVSGKSERQTASAKKVTEIERGGKKEANQIEFKGRCAGSR